ncbi:DUF4998 domain-containing protein [Proteiniphilum acetatigenes]|uniref:DUF4998 domain-containing protein n=1 Tax=Proteiniphilum acetatigenes TaxID=294710 RepID=UPI0008E7C275|nr:DUF4998 domain-containing protein [Proteiniphilum acetatigenes]SFL44490.1 F5/8 type C domain-containing protein [Porphyromonadaceae bacterium KH3CP3RA]
MNNSINKVYYILCIVLMVGFSSCGDMDETYRHFWENGEKVYPAPVDSLKIFTGRNRVALSWNIFGDPNVNSAKIFWNNRSDSLEVSIQSSGDKDSSYVVVDNLEEGTYSFEIFTYDLKGNRSVPRDGIGTVFGDVYERTLLPRMLHSANHKDDILMVLWGSMNDKTAIWSELYYKDLSGAQTKLIVQNDVDTTFIYDFDFESDPVLNYRTVYVPPTSIDTFYTNMRTIAAKGAPLQFEKTNWTATASSFDSRAGASYRPPEFTIDNNLATLWVNQVSPQMNYPHTLTIDMGEIKENVSGMSMITQRRNETPKTIMIEVSKDGISWNPMGTYNVENIADITQTFDFYGEEDIRFFRMIALTPWGNTPNIAIPEVGAYTYVY